MINIVSSISSIPITIYYIISSYFRLKYKESCVNNCRVSL